MPLKQWGRQYETCLMSFGEPEILGATGLTDRSGGPFQHIL
jgi:hypothetical protein